MREFRDSSTPTDAREEQPEPDSEKVVEKTMTHEIELVGRDAASEGPHQHPEQEPDSPRDESPQMDRHR